MPKSAVMGERVICTKKGLAQASILGLACGAVLLFFAIPDLGRCCIAANETAAISTLRNLVSAQEQFRERVAVDEDGDGHGEYGSMQELSAAIPLRVYVETSLSESESALVCLTKSESAQLATDPEREPRADSEPEPEPEPETETEPEPEPAAPC